ncbi:uncharacterized protein TRIVIDRAFT_143871 [Trichoderma virens Gv29-8]|uniref:Aminoglycoside phosphotransferase domain-containing protein n=1 Tax=Hypocrea virens (strain Gv29-8 / FGSC 10586) TaxID=413071 RepID=G9MIV8_HYPVG|nr:uncharacterized protein TRIVIDRAFT_143871 [Trichoderma virens Gv29-8]EHK25424.1 hypothetical protein TRIVIDRAFT_143871 [Trichoderma virens Gv29-8]
MTSNSPSSDSSYVCDDWPKMPDGTDYDRKQLFDLVLSGKSPFSDVWDVKQLIQEIEEHLDTKIVDIPYVHDGANCYSSLLAQFAHIRASLFNFQISPKFATTWFLKRLFAQKPDSLPVPVSATREFCITFLTSKIEATIGNIGDMIGWEDDHNTVGPRAAAAKPSLLRLIPHIIPTGDASLFRFVIEHGDFGIHNMSIAPDSDGKHHVTSVFDWEMGSVVPAFLSDPVMCVGPDLKTDGNASPSVSYWNEAEDPITPEELVRYTLWAKAYCEVLFREAPDYERAIRAGNDARYLWFALRGWKGDDPEDFFGDLGNWAEKRMKELGVNQEEA